MKTQAPTFVSPSGAASEPHGTYAAWLARLDFGVCDTPVATVTQRADRVTGADRTRSGVDVLP